jgi:hypothetical protein
MLNGASRLVDTFGPSCRVPRPSRLSRSFNRFRGTEWMPEQSGVRPSGVLTELGRRKAEKRSHYPTTVDSLIASAARSGGR